MVQHKILDSVDDEQAIETLNHGTEVNLMKDVFVGSQLYILYEDEETKQLSWYWGIVTDVNRNRKKGEYWHVYHDDEYPWIDLDKERDWKLLTETDKFYDQNFDIENEPKQEKNKTKTTKKSQSNSNSRMRRKTNKKPVRKRKHNRTVPIDTRKNGHRNPIKKPKPKYGIGNQGFALFGKKTYSCTITCGPETSNAVKLQETSFVKNPCTFWVRESDLTMVLENQSLLKQRVAFELAGNNDRYRVIEISEKKEFVKCYWKKGSNETWIDMDNFHVNLSSVSPDTSVPSNHSQTATLTPIHKNNNHNNNKTSLGDGCNDSDEETIDDESTKSDNFMVSTDSEAENENNNNNNHNHNNNNKRKRKRGRPLGSKNKKNVIPVKATNQKGPQRVTDIPQFKPQKQKSKKTQRNHNKNKNNANNPINSVQLFSDQHRYQKLHERFNSNSTRSVTTTANFAKHYASVSIQNGTTTTNQANAPQSEVIRSQSYPRQRYIESADQYNTLQRHFNHTYNPFVPNRAPPLKRRRVMNTGTHNSSNANANHATAATASYYNFISPQPDDDDIQNKNQMPALQRVPETTEQMNNNNNKNENCTMNMDTDGDTDALSKSNMTCESHVCHSAPPIIGNDRIQRKNRFSDSLMVLPSMLESDGLNGKLNNFEGLSDKERVKSLRSMINVLMNWRKAMNMIEQKIDEYCEVIIHCSQTLIRDIENRTERV